MCVCVYIMYTTNRSRIALDPGTSHPGLREAKRRGRPPSVAVAHHGLAESCLDVARRQEPQSRVCLPGVVLEGAPDFQKTG